jgi:hypothetical protein
VDGFVVHEVAADVAVRVVRQMPDLPPALDDKVERLCRRRVCGLREAGQGAVQRRVFSVDGFAADLVRGHLTEFRRVVAQMEQPARFTELGVRPLAVCGVLRCPDGVVMRRRHRGAVDRRGWQLRPLAAWMRRRWTRTVRSICAAVAE